VVRISFDSDLDAATVGATGITLLGPSGALPAEVHYEVETRTVVIRLLDAPSGTLTLAVADAVHDIAGQPLAGGYATTLQS
jgi:Bacterial Ig-like domain